MSTLRTLSKFQSKLQGGGARPNLFEVSIPDLPDAAKNSSPAATWGSEEQEDFTIMCKGAQLPASTIASIDVPFRGRILKVAGDRTIENWTVTVINVGVLIGERVDFVVDAMIARVFTDAIIGVVTDVGVDVLTDVSVNVVAAMVTALEFAMSTSLEE